MAAFQRRLLRPRRGKVSVPRITRCQMNQVSWEAKAQAFQKQMLSQEAEVKALQEAHTGS